MGKKHLQEQVKLLRKDMDQLKSVITDLRKKLKAGKGNKLKNKSKEAKGVRGR